MPSGHIQRSDPSTSSDEFLQAPHFKKPQAKTGRAAEEYRSAVKAHTYPAANDLYLVSSVYMEVYQRREREKSSRSTSRVVEFEERHTIRHGMGSGSEL